MLRGIPANLSPDLVKALMELGHGDEILLADANYPVGGRGGVILRADGLGVEELLTSILTLLPLDHYSQAQWGLMQTVGDDPTPPIWASYEQIVTAADPQAHCEHIERFAFYERARGAALTVVTGETALYGNVLLRKGVVVL